MGKSSTSFKPGEGGRPPGVKNKNYTNVNCWLELIWERIPEMSFDEQVANAWKAVNALLPKVPVLSASPGDSVSNAQKTAELMNGLAPVDPPLESNPGANGGVPTNGTEGSNGHG